MSKLLKARGAQTVLQAEFTFNYDDTMLDINGVEKTFGSVFTDVGVFDAIGLPEGSVVVGGELVVETAGAGPTAYTVAVGDAGSATRYAAATSVLATGRTALTLTGFYATTDAVRLTINSTVANATAGKFTVRVQYTIPGRANEVSTAA